MDDLVSTIRGLHHLAHHKHKFHSLSFKKINLSIHNLLTKVKNKFKNVIIAKQIIFNM